MAKDVQLSQAELTLAGPGVLDRPHLADQPIAEAKEEDLVNRHFPAGGLVTPPLSLMGAAALEASNHGVALGDQLL
jgi:hypothetical protein